MIYILNLKLRIPSNDCREDEFIYPPAMDVDKCNIANNIFHGYNIHIIDGHRHTGFLFTIGMCSKTGGKKNTKLRTPYSLK